MKHVTKSVKGRHQISDETGLIRVLGVTKSVTSLPTIYQGQRNRGESIASTSEMGGIA